MVQLPEAGNVEEKRRDEPEEPPKGWRERAVSTLKRLEAKDALTLAVSVAAVAISVWSLLQGSSAADREARIQLTNVSERIISLPIETTKFMIEHAIQANDPRFVALTSTINQQNLNLARQALILLDTVDDDEITDVDFSTTAYALTLIGDLGNADRLYRKAIENSKTSLSKLTNRRAYANFLFVNLGRYDDAREIYREAVNIFEDDTVYGKWTKGITYQYWAMMELQGGYSEEAENKLEEARKVFNQINNPVIRSQAIQTLDMTISTARAQLMVPFVPEDTLPPAPLVPKVHLEPRHDAQTAGPTVGGIAPD